MVATLWLFLTISGRRKPTPKFVALTMVEKKSRGRIRIDRERCKGCHLCMEVCPNRRIRPDGALNLKGYTPACFQEQTAEGEKGCTACTQCAIVCPEVAIEVYRAE